MHLSKTNLLKSFLSLGAVGLLVGCPSGGKPKIEVDAVLPLTGEAAIYGQSIRRGIELAVEEVAADEEFAYSIEVVYQDSEGDAAKAVELAAQDFEKAVAIIGGVTSDEALAMAPVARERDRILISPSASSPELSGIAPGNFYRIFPSSATEASAVGNFIRDKLRFDTVTLLIEDSSFGKGGLAAFKEVWTDQIAGEFTFTKGSAEELSAAVAGALETGDKTIYVIALGQDLIAAINTLRESGWGGEGYRILTTSALATPSVLDATGTNAHNVYFTQTAVDLKSDVEPIKGFVDSYTAKFGEAPDLYSAYGYDAVQVVAQALREGGTGGALLSGDFKKGIRAISDLKGVTGSLQFRESGDVQQFVRMFYVTEDGELVDFDKWYKDFMEAQRERLRELEERRRKLLQDASN